MSEKEASAFDIQQLRRGLRDLAALSALPIIWTESHPRRIAESLAEALLHMLHLELVYVVVRDRAYEIPIEVAHTARGPAPTAQAEEIGRALDPWLHTDDLSRTPSSIANPLGNGMTRIICPPFGIQARGGVLVACSPRADFPSEVDRLLLSVAANQVAILLDRRRTDDALRESEERFRGTFENAGVGIADCDLQGRFLRVNQKLCEIVGYTREELLQKTGQDITHPDDLAASLEQFLPLLRGEQPGYSLEKRLVRKDGSLVWIDQAVSLRRDAAGNPASVIAILQDISKRRRLEEELSQANARLELAVRGSNINIYEMNMPDGVLENGRWEAISVGDQNSGFDRSELPTDFESFMARVHPDDRERMVRAMRAYLSGQSREYEAEYGGWRKDGSYRWSLARGVAERDAEGRAIHLMISSVDITDRKWAEEALRESEERFRGTFENAAVGIAHTHPEGRFLRVNERFCAIVGYPRDELLEKTWQDISHPDDLAASIEVTAAGLRGEWPDLPLEKRYLRKDGSLVWGELVVSLQRDTAGAPGYLIAIVQDISQRKRLEEALRESERRFRTFVDHATDAFFLLDDRLVVVDVNRQACQSLGYARDELVGMSPLDFDPDVAPAMLEEFGRRLDAGEMLVFESRHRRKDGSRFPVEVRGRPFWEGGRRLTVALARDITEHKRAEQELLQARDELETKVAERTAELRRATAELQTILDASPVGIALFGRDHTVLRCNPAFERILGWTADEIAGRPSFVLHADQEKWSALTEKLNRGELFAKIETRLLRKDGSEFDAALSCAPLQAEAGSPAGFVAAVEDITERKRAEEELRESERRYRSIFQGAGVSIWEEDFSQVKAAIDDLKARGVLDFRQYLASHPEFVQHALSLIKIIDVNDATVKLFAAEKKEELLESLHRIFLPETEDVFAEELLALSEERTSLESETVVRTLKGDKLTVLITITFPPPSAKFDSVLVSIMDITERKRAEEERQAHLWFFESMDRVNRAIQGTNDLEQMMSDVLDTVLSIFECDRAWLVYPCDPEATSWQVPMEHARPQFPGLFALGLDVPADPEVVELFQIVRDSCAPVRLGPGSDRPLPADVAKRFSIQSQIVMAIHPKVDKPYMFGLHQCSYPRVWTPREEQLFQEIGRRLADALTGLLMFRNLRDSEARLEQAQRIAHLGHWDRDLDTDRLTFSDETYRIFGLPPQERTIDYAGLRELIHPEDLPINDRAREEALRGGPRYDLEFRAVRPGGEVRILHSQGDVTRDESGRPRRIFGTVQDITERKRAEQVLRENQQLLQAIFDNANVGIHVKDLEGRYLLVNRWLEEAVGRSGDEILGKTDFELLPQESARRQREFDRKVLEAGAALEKEEVFQLQGGPRWFLKIQCPLFDPSGEPYATCGIATDITERRAKEAAEAANRAKDEFLANVSHEIRTPMNAILGMTELVLDTPLTDDQRQCLRTVKSAADNLLGNINDLLDFSKIEAGKLELDPADFSLRAKVGDTLRALAVRAHRKGLELIYDVQPEVPDALVGDAGRLRQVLLNMVANAIKFTDTGEVLVRVEVAGEAAPEGDVGLQFTVRDTGIGIPRDHQERIFRAFEQEDSSTTRRYGGTGLGLTIAARLVALMGGGITVESEPGRGSTFAFTARLGLQPHPPEHDCARPPVLLHNLPVLVVDDNATNRHILEEWLRGWQMEPAAVGDGLAALDALWDAVSMGRPYALVLLDARMPDTDGLALAAKIRKRSELAATRIILLTSGERPGDWDRIREQRIDAHLLKPVQQDELLDTIYRVMSRANGDAPLVAGPVRRWDQAAAPLPATAPLHILVAEDNEINAQLLERLLARRGHRVRLATNGRDALALAEEGVFDLMLLDVQMPELDGFQVVQAVRERERSTGGHLPVIALTARARQEDRDRCLAAGMDDFLAKPIQAADLWTATERVTGSHPPAERPAPGLLDPRVLLAACGDDAATLEKIREVLRARLPDHLMAVQDALQERDAIRLREAAHKLRGTLAPFSTVVGAMASDLEEQAARGHLEEARPLVEQLEALAPELIKQVDGESIESLRDQASTAGDRDRTDSP